MHFNIRAPLPWHEGTTARLARMHCLLCCLSMVLVPACWAGCHLASAVGPEKTWFYAALGMVPLALLGLSCSSELTLRHIGVLFRCSLCLFIGWCVQVVAYHGFDPAYALGLMALVPAAGVIYALDLEWEGWLERVFGAGALLGSIMLFMSTTPQIALYPFLAATLGIAVLIFGLGCYSLHARAKWRLHDADLAKAEEDMLRLKEAFLSNMNHEIRTPLTSILGFAQVLNDEVRGEQREFVELITQNGQRLLDTLNAILELSWLESDVLPVEIEEVDVTEVVREQVMRFKPQAQAKGLSIGVLIRSGRAVARLDRAALQRVMDKMISNAIKFTERGLVTVIVDADDRQVHIQVRDTGIGISPAFRPHLFEAFWQESDGLARTHEGSGLGLAITKQLVERMGGVIQVDSQQGQGTMFTVSFPRTFTAAETSRPRNPQAAVSGSLLRLLTSAKGKRNREQHVPGYPAMLYAHEDKAPDTHRLRQTAARQP